VFWCYDSGGTCELRNTGGKRQIISRASAEIVANYARNVELVVVTTVARHHQQRRVLAMLGAVTREAFGERVETRGILFRAFFARNYTSLQTINAIVIAVVSER